MLEVTSYLQEQSVFSHTYCRSVSQSLVVSKRQETKGLELSQDQTACRLRQWKNLK